MGKEVPATSDILTPDTPEAPEIPPEDSERAFVRRTAAMSVGTALSRLTGFLRVSATAFALGVAQTRLATAYTIANNTPNIVYELVLGGVLTSVFVPVFVQWLDERGREDAWDVARSVLTIAFAALSAITVVTVLAAPWIVRLYMVGATGRGVEAARAFATFCLRLFMPQIIFYGIGAVATGLLNAHRRFAAPMFAPILNNLIVIGTMLAFVAIGRGDRPTPASISNAQRWLLAVGTTLGVVGMTLALWPSLRRLGFRFRWRLEWRHPAVRRVARLALWTLVYVVANQLGLLVVIIMATGRSGYAAYTAALILFQLPHAIFAVSIFTALLPALSTRWTARDVDGFRTLLSQGIRATAVIVVPAAAGYLVLATPVVRLILQHGAATARDTELVAGLLRSFALGLFFFSLFQLLLRAFYAMQDTRTPALVNVAAVVVNTGANLLFFFTFRMHLVGLALGYTASYAFGSIALLALIRRRLHHLEGRRIAASMVRTSIASGATAAVAWVVARTIGHALGTATVSAQVVQVSGSVVAGLLAFVLSALIVRLDEVDVMRRQLTTRWTR
ncbi:MAG TPA: murein biosynthesis integral membrane protein MurJ [Actinomycetota bacterium]|nr:murein biosynthesis integral membrane protein MurJ [Actinomycetota bacterium]